MSELYLLLQFSDANKAFMAGDTAQTIARGVGFRFAELKTLFKRIDDEVVFKVRVPSLCASEASGGES